MLHLLRNLPLSPKKKNQELEEAQRVSNELVVDKISITSPLSHKMSPLKAISYHIVGRVDVQGPAKVDKRTLKTIALLSIAEIGFKTVLPSLVQSAMLEDIYKFLKAFNSTDRRGQNNYFSSSVDIKRLINIPVYPVSTGHINKGINRSLMIIAPSEDRIILKFEIILKTGDNTIKLADYFDRNGYITTQLRKTSLNTDLVTIAAHQTKSSHYLFEEVTGLISGDRTIEAYQGIRKTLART
uniref:Uncharacterized protein n=1 Tax=Coleopteran rhabdo-related virus OKIAV20 TaxID=2746287 RepID=A0A7D7F0X1_9RHAB|nr:hypothetical protein [Coleopteran rhabdo-related virus OKIAV20]